MRLSRRSFVKAASVTGVGAFTAPLIAARGSEALRDGILFSSLGSENKSIVLEQEERAPYRLASPGAVRLDSNENPNGPGATAIEAIKGMFGEASRYPDQPEEDLKAAIAQHLGVKPENVLLGCGSGEVLRMSVYAFTNPQRSLVTALPSFEDPVRHAEITRAPVHAVPVDAQLRLDLGQMLDQSGEAGLVFFCNPNNPTATVHGDAAVREFINGVNRKAPECVVLVDEAYHEYVEDKTYRTAIPMALENPNVIVSRTFSKVFGMAGMRAGYAIGRPETLARLRRYKLGSNVNVLAAAAGIATLKDDAHIKREVDLNRAAREFTRRVFADLGFKSGESNANFIMVPINRDSKAFKDAVAKRGFLVGRQFPPLTTYARISIGTMDEMKRAADVFRQVLSGAAD